MFRSIQTKTMFFLVTLAICLTVIIGYMTVFAMDYAIEGLKHDDMRDKVLTASRAVSQELEVSPVYKAISVPLWHTLFCFFMQRAGALPLIHCGHCI